MNRLDQFLSELPESDDAWHCPWFKVIELFAGNGVLFGIIAYCVAPSIFAVVAILIGLIVGSFTLGTRRKGQTTC